MSGTFIFENKPRIWKFTMRSLGYLQADRRQFVLRVACRTDNEKDALLFAKKTVHVPSWWDNYIVQQIEMEGDLWAIDGYFAVAPAEPPERTVDV